jgi:uncharacterized damage-inducible protein DinB
MITNKAQYELVKEAREALFTFCESLSWEDYIRPVPNFGQGSIRKTQAHIADVYIHWIDRYAMQKTTSYLDDKSINSIKEIRAEYQKINELVAAFFEQYDSQENLVIKHILGRHGEVISTPLTVITHVITHEFHHKGQLVSMARIMGYQPPDTDLIRL